MNKQINLDLPVDAYDAEGNLTEKYASSVSEEHSTEGSQPEEKPVIEKKEDEVTEEQRVPYSRFDSVRQRAERAEREADEARDILRRALADSLPKATPSPSSYEEEYSREIKKLYGDTPVAKEIIEINLRQQRAIEERAEQRALEAMERREREASESLSQNESIIDTGLENLSERLGRQLTEKEEAALLDIVDEYTPTGADGRYAGAILPFDKAWSIYEMKNATQNQSSKRARSAATAASSNSSQGDSTSSTEDRDKNFNPMNWKSLYDRISRN